MQANRREAEKKMVDKHYGNENWVLNCKLTSDPVTEEFVGDDEANGLRVRPARTLWVF